MPRLFAPKPKPEVVPVAPVVAPPPPSGLTKDEVRELVGGAVAGVAQQLTQTVAQLGQKVEELATRQPQVIMQQPAAVATHTSEEVSDQEIDSAVLSGTGAAARIRAMVDRAVDRATTRVINEHVKPLQDYGVNTIGELSRRITSSGMKHYPRFKKEIDAQLSVLTPDVRANPIVIETIYNAVVGLHTEELVREATEAAVRQAQDGSTAGGATAPGTAKPGQGSTSPGTGAGPGATRETPEVPTVERVGGDAGLEALSHKGSSGQNADEFARGMGYKDWADYQKQYSELLAAETAGNA